jgi:hypothetical protein
MLYIYDTNSSGGIKPSTLILALSFYHRIEPVGATAPRVLDKNLIRLTSLATAPVGLQCAGQASPVPAFRWPDKLIHKFLATIFKNVFFLGTLKNVIQLVMLLKKNLIQQINWLNFSYLYPLLTPIGRLALCENNALSNTLSYVINKFSPKKILEQAILMCPFIHSLSLSLSLSSQCQLKS